MITWTQIYWYLITCPKLKLDGDPFEVKNQRIAFLNKNLRSAIVALYNSNDSQLAIDTLYGELKEALDKESSSIIRYKRVLVETLETISVNMQLLKSRHNRSTAKHINGENTFTYKNMLANHDFVRRKSTGEYQLGYILLLDKYPTENMAAALYHHGNYMGRIFELTHDYTPTILFYYFPLLGDEYSFVYNDENNLEVIGSLISQDVYYAKVTPLCNQCNRCNATWVNKER